LCFGAPPEEIDIDRETFQVLQREKPENERPAQINRGTFATGRQGRMKKSGGLARGCPDEGVWAYV
jgi:hypothetical protein